MLGYQLAEKGLLYSKLCNSLFFSPRFVVSLKGFI